MKIACKGRKRWKNSNFMTLFYGWDSAVLSYRVTVKKQFTFNCQVLRRSWYSFDQTRKIERLCQPWIHPVVLRLETLDLESSVLTTKPLLHENQYGEYGENQLAAIGKKTILHTLSKTHDSIDLSNTADKSLAVFQGFSFSQDI